MKYSYIFRQSFLRRVIRWLFLMVATVVVVKGCALGGESSSPEPVSPSVRESDRMETRTGASEWMSWTAPVASLPPLELPRESFEDRAQQLIQYHATHPPNRSPTDDPTGYAKSGVYTAMARYASQNIAGGNQMAEYIFDHPHKAAMFLTMAGMDLYLRYHEVMPPTLQTKIRHFVTHRGDYTGGQTENHSIMLAAAGYLAAQTWPTWDRASSVKQETQAHLFQFIEDMAYHGIVEYDSPVYHVFFVNSLLSLRDHATDPEMQRKATIGLELLLATMAPEWMQGYWPSSTLRTYGFTHDPLVGSLSGTVGWLYWGGSPMPPPQDGCAVMGAVSEYRVPDILVQISQDRRLPYVHRETQGQNFNREDKYRKSTYIDRQYALFSQFDGNGQLAWHQQLQRMGVVWVSNYPGATFVVKHPVDGMRGDSPDGQVVQHERALVGLYEDALTAYLPTNKSILATLETDHWLFFHGGTLLLGAYFPQGYARLAPIEVEGNRFQQLQSQARHNGIVLQTAAPEEFAGETPDATLAAFARVVKTQTQVDTSRLQEQPSHLAFTSLAGHVLELTFKGDHSVDGQVLNYHTWPLMENPWMRSDPGRFLEIRYGDKRRYYDFKNWTIQAS